MEDIKIQWKLIGSAIVKPTALDGGCFAKKDTAGMQLLARTLICNTCLYQTL